MDEAELARELKVLAKQRKRVQKETAEVRQQIKELTGRLGKGASE